MGSRLRDFWDRMTTTTIDLPPGSFTHFKAARRGEAIIIEFTGPRNRSIEMELTREVAIEVSTAIRMLTLPPDKT